MARLVIVVAGVAMALLMIVSGLAAPAFINYQGILAQAGGTPVPPGSYDVTFRIYDALTGGDVVWGPETHTVSITNAGSFHVKLGSVIGNINACFNGSDRWLGMKVGSDPEMTPLTPIGSVPYAMMAGTVADFAIGQDKLAEKAVGRGQIGDTVVGRGQLGEKAVGRGQIGDTAVGRGQIGDTVVGRGQLGKKAVGTEQLDDEAVGLGQLKDGLINWELLGGHITSIGEYGFSRANNVLYGMHDSTHVNLGVACETGVSGFNNKYATVSGGVNNLAGGDYATVPGGVDNVALGIGSFAAGQQARAMHDYSFVWNGSDGLVFGSTADNQFLVYAPGGVGVGTNTPTSQLDVAGTVTMTGFQLPINAVGGYVLTSSGTNGTGTWQPAVSGGPAWGLTGNAGTSETSNFLGTTDDEALEIRVNNSRALRFEPNGTSPNLIGGHPTNYVTSGFFGSFIGGGGGTGTEVNYISGTYGTIGGGAGNQISGLAAGAYATIAGGWQNTTDHNFCVIGGGESNDAHGDAATVAGGFDNQASGHHSAILGGYGNNADGDFSAVPGGDANRAHGKYSFAVGVLAKANHDGSIVLAASYPETGEEFNASDSIASSGREQLVIRADSGIYLTNLGGATPGFGNRFINTSTGAYLSKGGQWTNSSDKNRKENFTAVNEQDILSRLEQLPVTQWNYKTDDRGELHVGPMAQDFYAQFGLGSDSTAIGTVDVDGIALAAIKALAGQNHELRAQIEELRRTVEGFMKQPIGSGGSSSSSTGR